MYNPLNDGKNKDHEKDNVREGATDVGSDQMSKDILDILKLDKGWIHVEEGWEDTINDHIEYKETQMDLVKDAKKRLLKNDKSIKEVGEAKDITWIDTLEDNTELSVETRWVVYETRKKVTDRLFVKKFKNAKESFQEWLVEMLKAWIINKEQKEEVEKSLESPQVMESIRTWAAVLGFSGVYTVTNSFTITPVATVIWWPFAWIIAWLVMYFLKRVGVNLIVKYFGKHLDRRNYISNMSLIPVLWEQMALIELYRSHPLAAQYFFADTRTKKLKEKYVKETDSSKKEEIRVKREEKVNKNVKWIGTMSDWVVNFETTIWDFFGGIGEFISKPFKKNTTKAE